VTNSREDDTGNRRERRVMTAFGRGKIRWKVWREKPDINNAHSDTRGA